MLRGIKGTGIKGTGIKGTDGITPDEKLQPYIVYDIRGLSYRVQAESLGSNASLLSKGAVQPNVLHAATYL